MSLYQDYEHYDEEKLKQEDWKYEIIAELEELV